MVENRASEETPRDESFKETPLYKLLNGLDNWLAIPLGRAVERNPCGF